MVRSVVAPCPRRALSSVALLAAGLLPVAVFAWTQPNPSSSESAIPAGAKGANYAKGYLTVTGYFGSGVDPSDPADATATTAAIQKGLDDACKYNKVLLIPAGTYYINDTLHAWSATGTPAGLGYTSGMPRRNHCSVVGSNTGTRPLIKLVTNASGFGNGASETTAKPAFEFKNFELIAGTSNPDWSSAEAPSKGYYQMLRNVNIDTNHNAGAIGLYFNQAQDGSIEDVSITATDSFAGIRGLPARASAATVNVSITGGKYGIDILGTGYSGSTLANIELLDQTESALRHNNFGVMTVVGFRIRQKAGDTGPVLKMEATNGNAHPGEYNLIDGIIELNNVPATAAIDNTAARNFYARRVYVRTTSGTAANNKLIKNGTTVTTSAATQDGSSGQYWVRIKEFSYRRKTGPDSSTEQKDSQSLINGTVTTGTAAGGDAVTLEALVGGAVPLPPSNIVTRSGWVRKPFFQDSDAKDLVGLNPSGVITSQSTTGGITTYQINSASFQTFLNTAGNEKVFLRAGIYRLNNTITLNADNVIFGVDRALTRIETNWKPTANTMGSDGVPVIATVDDSEATTYLGDLSIGVFVGGEDDDNDSNPDNAHPSDRFNALYWRAGRKSLVHIGQTYALDSGQPPYASNAHSVIYITGNGGGRWYGAGLRKAFATDDPAWCMIRVSGTTQPLSFYGMDLEHGAGPLHYALIENADNIRVYGIKNEMYYPANPNNPVVVVYASTSSVISFTNCVNVGLFGVSALRNALTPNKGLVQFTDCDQAVASLVTPQLDDYDGGLIGPVVREKTGTANAKTIAFPNVVSLYKDGEPDDGLVAHQASGYYGP